jgi:hypothetical protein
VSSVFDILEVVDIALQLALLFLLLRGPFKRYAILFVNSVASMVTITIERMVSRDRVLFRKVYWSDEVILDLLLFLVVIALTNLALEGNPLRPRMSRVLAGIVLLAVVLPFVVLHPPFFTSGIQWSGAWGRWFNSTGQMLNFGAAIMNLALWSALLTSRNRDSQLLKVSIGVGVAVAGQAIGFGIRRFLPTESAAREFPDLLMGVTHLLSVLIWCSAFWERAKKPQTPALTPQ